MDPTFSVSQHLHPKALEWAIKTLHFGLALLPCFVVAQSLLVIATAASYEFAQRRTQIKTMDRKAAKWQVQKHSENLLKAVAK